MFFGGLSSRLLASVRSFGLTSSAGKILQQCRALPPVSSTTCFGAPAGSAAISSAQVRFASNKPDKKPKGHAFPQFANLPPVHRIAGQGNAYVTKVERKRLLVDPSLPNFDHIEPLKWTTWRMLRDVRRRTLFTRYFFKRTALYNTRKCGLLPSFVREAAKEEEFALPRDSQFHMMHIRCAVSGRSRGLLKKYRLSRLVWRNLADNNKLSGVIKASW